MMQTSEKTYEMLWDCKYCGQRKNLGLTHRHCPQCGGPQDAGSRYFPPDHEKVAVQDHPFAGADVHCPVCKNAMSRAAKCCGNCGAPLAGGADVRIVQAPVAPPPPKKGLNPLFIILPIVAVLGLGTILFFVFRKRAGSFLVESTAWERTIQIEKYDTKRESAWCDSVPADGKIVGRHKEQRSSKQVEDGQTCTTRKQDMGNGTYKEIQECKPKYKSEPVYDEKCDYDAMRWQNARVEKAAGATSPKWPDVKLAKTGTCSGCEREGTRKETYTVNFKEPSSGKTASCDFPEAKWNGFKAGSHYDGKIGMTGIDCDSLVAR